MYEDTEKIVEISLSKIEVSKSRKVCSKSSMLHRTLLVNSVISRVRNSERPAVKTELPLMNYREPKCIVDMEDYDTEKLFTLGSCQTRCTNPLNSHNHKRTLSTLVTKLSSISCSGKADGSVTKHLHRIEDFEGKENIIAPISGCSRLSTDLRRLNHTQKRLHSGHSDTNEQLCPKKKLRCIWPSNVVPTVQDLNYSIAGLASLFGDLVADNNNNEKSNDVEKSAITLGGGFTTATAMVAC